MRSALLQEQLLKTRELINFDEYVLKKKRAGEELPAIPIPRGVRLENLSTVEGELINF